MLFISLDVKMFSLFKMEYTLDLGFPGGSDGEESTCKAEDLGSIPGLGRSPKEGNGNSLQESCLENPMDRGAWGVTVRGVTEVGQDKAYKESTQSAQRKEEIYNSS